MHGAPITYVAAALSHSKATPALRANVGHQSGTKSKSGAPGVLEAPDKNGGPSRTRTLDPLIKSQLLYQLS